MTYHAKVIAGGKIVIPAELRREFGINDGDSLVLEREPGGGFSVKTFAQVVREERQAFRAAVGPDATLDSFLAANQADWRE